MLPCEQAGAEGYLLYNPFEALDLAELWGDSTLGAEWGSAWSSSGFVKGVDVPL